MSDSNVYDCGSSISKPNEKQLSPPVTVQPELQSIQADEQHIQSSGASEQQSDKLKPELEKNILMQSVIIEQQLHHVEPFIDKQKHLQSCDSDNVKELSNTEQQIQETSDVKQQLQLQSCNDSPQIKYLQQVEQVIKQSGLTNQGIQQSNDEQEIQQSNDEQEIQQSNDEKQEIQKSIDEEQAIKQSNDEKQEIQQSNLEQEIKHSNDEQVMQHLNKVEQEMQQLSEMEQEQELDKMEQEQQLDKMEQDPQLDEMEQDHQLDEMEQDQQLDEMEQDQQLDEIEQDQQLDKIEDNQQLDKMEKNQQLDKTEENQQIDNMKEDQEIDNMKENQEIDKMKENQQLDKMENKQQLDTMEHEMMQQSDDVKQQIDLKISSLNDVKQQVGQFDNIKEIQQPNFMEQMQQLNGMEQNIQQLDDVESQLQQSNMQLQEQQSDDLSFDLISRQKLSLTSQSVGIINQEQLSPKGPSSVQVFEEDARSSWTTESTKTTPLKESIIDETSQNSIESQKSGLKRRYSDDESDVMTFPPENVFEYMWPIEKGEFYFLQEQISDFLSVKSFKRKYPDLQRRIVDIDEKDFLRERGVVTETQCDLGLTALRSDDVLELMSRDYPEKYKSYIQVLREKEKQTMTEKQKEHISTVSDKNKMAECLRKAIKSASEYNAHLNQERKEERRSCYDLQTFTIHYPVGVNKVKYVPPKIGKYPVALLPGQFQDSYKKYTPEELKYLPLNTVLYGPLQELKNIQSLSDGSHSDSEDSSASDGSCSSSQGTHDDGSGDSTSGSERNAKPQSTSNVLTEKSISKMQTSYKLKDKFIVLCKVCKLGSGTGKDERNEPFIHCSQCERNGHPTCLQLTVGVVDVLKTYPWQCMDCKNCSHCRNQNNKDKMLICDNCDRGYHIYCVGLKILPQGKWICQLCGYCAICGATKAGPDPTKAQWQYDVHTLAEQALSVTRRPKIVCQACFKRKH